MKYTSRIWSWSEMFTIHHVYVDLPLSFEIATKKQYENNNNKITLRNALQIRAERCTLKQIHKRFLSPSNKALKFQIHKKNPTSSELTNHQLLWFQYAVFGHISLFSLFVLFQFSNQLETICVQLSLKSSNLQNLDENQSRFWARVNEFRDSFKHICFCSVWRAYWSIRFIAWHFSMTPVPFHLPMNLPLDRLKNEYFQERNSAQMKNEFQHVCLSKFLVMWCGCHLF